MNAGHTFPIARRRAKDLGVDTTMSRQRATAVRRQGLKEAEKRTSRIAKLCKASKGRAKGLARIGLQPSMFWCSMVQGM